MTRVLLVPSGHALSEADDMLTLSRMGFEWYSTGYYTYSDQPGDLPRAPTYFVHDDFIEKYKQCRGWTIDHLDSPIGQKNAQYTDNMVATNRWRFTQEFIDQFDVVIITHLIDNITDNLDILKNKLVILKTFGMHHITQEPTIYLLRNKFGVQVVRNSPVEHVRTPYYAGHDAIIRGSVVVDEDEISGWTGDLKQVMTLTSNFNHDSSLGQYRRNLYLQILRDNPNVKFILHGAANDNEPLSKGFISHKDKVELLRRSRISLITGTPQANNTYSLVESWIMGIPMIVFDKNMWWASNCEAEDLITHGEDGFIIHDPKEAKQYIDMLFSDNELAQSISRRAREKAVQTFGRATIINQWTKFFNDRGII